MHSSLGVGMVACIHGLHARWLDRSNFKRCPLMFTNAGRFLAAPLLILWVGSAFADGTPVPPIAKRIPHLVESPNGDRSDDYYWLRDDSRQSKDVLDYLNAENAYRDALMKPTEALQEKLYAEMVARLKPDDASVPVLDHGYWYYTRFEAGKDYPIYGRRKGSMEAPEEVMLDGNAMAKGHAFFQIGATSVSPNGRLLAYTEDDVGRRQYVLRVKDLATGEILGDQITNVMPEVVWAADNRTLLYIEKDPVTLLSVRVHTHRLGTRSADPVVYEEADHSYYLSIHKSRSERYVFIELESTNQSEWRYADATDPKLRFRTVVPRSANHEYQVEHLGANFVLRTNWRAENFRIVLAPIGKAADRTAWHEVVPSSDRTFIQHFEVSTHFLAVGVRQDGLSKIRIRSWDGREDKLIEAEETAYAMNLIDTPDIHSPVVRYGYSSLVTPRTIFDYHATTGTRTLRKIDTVPGYDSNAYVTEFLRVPARDGKLVPVSLAYRKGTVRNGSAPLFQYAYGSYGISSDPVFRSNWISLMDRGFVVAIAHVRGGQELGRAWYEDGRLLHKRNPFTDFIAVTDGLVARGYAAKDKVFAEGGSAGGLLMGAIANLAPDRYRGIMALVPFVDVVTTMLDESIPLTTNEFDQWGNPKEKTYYDYMLSYSPYDHVEAKDYPALYVQTSLWDSQVQYFEPAKWVAKLRAMKTDSHPLVFNINMAGGHGGKSGRFQRFHDTALEYAFILKELGVQD